MNSFAVCSWRHTVLHKLPRNKLEELILFCEYVTECLYLVRILFKHKLYISPSMYALCVYRYADISVYVLLRLVLFFQLILSFRFT